MICEMTFFFAYTDLPPPCGRNPLQLLLTFKTTNMKRFGSLLIYSMLLLTAACKKNLTDNMGVAPDDQLSEKQVRVTALTKEVARALEEVYRDNKACAEVNAAILSGYYADERVLLKDLLLPSSSALYKTDNCKSTKVDTGVFSKRFCEIIERGDYPLLTSELRTVSLLKRSADKAVLSNDATLSVDYVSVFSGASLISVYFPYSENFTNLADVSKMAPDSKIAIMLKPTIVYTDRDGDAGPGKDAYYCPGSPGNICYRDVMVDDAYAEKNPTHIITVGADIVPPAPAPVPKNELVTRIYSGACKLTRQMDKFISFTGNGGGSEIKVCRINAYLRRSDEQVSDFSGDVVTLNFSRADIRKKRWKRVYAVWDPNWNYQDVEQIYAVYEDDNTGSASFDGSLTTNLTLPGKLGKAEGKIGFNIDVKTQDEIITQKKLDRKSYLRDGLNNQGWGFYPDADDFLGGKDWPVFDGGAVWQYTLPYRIY
jgi:hypothetical protein